MLSTLLLIGLALGGSPPVSDFEREAVAARQAIESAVIEIETKKLAPNGDVTVEAFRRLWLSGENLRQDVQRRLSGAPLTAPPTAPGKEPPRGVSIGPGQENRIVSCYCGDDFIHYIEPRDPELRVALLVEKGGRKDGNLQRPLDPRWIGMAPIDVGNLLHFGAIDSLVGNPVRAKVTETKDKWEGQPAVRVRFEHTKKGTATIEVVIVPAWGHSVVRISESDETIERWVESKVALDKPSTLWFPVACTFRKTAGGKTTIDEQSTIKVISLNEPVDPVVFEPAGFELPTGTPIVYSGERKQFHWNGKEVVEGKIKKE